LGLKLLLYKFLIDHISPDSICSLKLSRICYEIFKFIVQNCYTPCFYLSINFLFFRQKPFGLNLKPRKHYSSVNIAQFLEFLDHCINREKFLYWWILHYFNLLLKLNFFYLIFCLTCRLMNKHNAIFAWKNVHLMSLLKMLNYSSLCPI